MDKIEKEIIEQGYVDNQRLWRRWILAQIWRSISKAEKPENREDAFEHEFFQMRSTPYKWDTVLQEMKAQSRISWQELQIRQKFFNPNTVLHMTEDYTRLLEDWIQKEQTGLLPSVDHVHPWNCSPSYNTCETLWLDNIHSPNINEYRKQAQKLMDEARLAKWKDSTKTLIRPLAKFIQRHIHPTWSTFRSIAWESAFKAAGAYYAMDNLIRFHDCIMPGLEPGPEGRYQSLKQVDQLVDKYADVQTPENAHVLFQTMLDLMDANTFSW